jgi:hypothetical protein
MLEAEPAAEKIIVAVEKGKKLYAFPWFFYVLIRLSRLLPERLIGTLVNRARY